MNIIVSIIILNLLIGLHELGHFLAAKLCKIGVEEFSLGMGPKLCSKKIGETRYSIRWVLLGGFVKLDEYEFKESAWWKQIIVILSGVLFNFIFAIIAVWIYIALSKEMNFGFIGGMLAGIQIVINMIKTIFLTLMEVFRAVDTTSFAGPVGVVEAVSTYVESGFIDVVEIFAVLNINLFVMNLMPIPMLDGGQAVLTLIKKLFNKKEMPKFETVWNIIGLIFVGAIFFFAIKNDIVGLFR